jgi:hypothetical protein
MRKCFGLASGCSESWQAAQPRADTTIGRPSTPHVFFANLGIHLSAVGFAFHAARARKEICLPPALARRAGFS